MARKELLRAGFEPATYGCLPWGWPTTVHRSTNWAIEGYKLFGQLDGEMIRRRAHTYDLWRLEHACASANSATPLHVRYSIALDNVLMGKLLETALKLKACWALSNQLQSYKITEWIKIALVSAPYWKWHTRRCGWCWRPNLSSHPSIYLGSDRPTLMPTK